MTREAATIRGEIHASLAECRMQQKDLARLIGMDEGTLSKKMHGRPFNETELIAIKNAFRWKSIGGRER